jgi:hypothetical protein
LSVPSLSSRVRTAPPGSFINQFLLDVLTVYFSSARFWISLRICTRLIPQTYKSGWAAAKPPGSSLRRLAERILAPATYAFVLKPTLSDLAEEHALALVENRLWKARWVRLRGYGSFWAGRRGSPCCQPRRRD